MATGYWRKRSDSKISRFGIEFDQNNDFKSREKETKATCYGEIRAQGRHVVEKEDAESVGMAILGIPH